MRTKVQEFPCRDEAGNDAVVIERKIQADGIQSDHAYCKQFALADGSPVAPWTGSVNISTQAKLFISD